MAGGPHASVVPCSTCLWEHRTLTRAPRISEGIETDWYCCDRGHRFGIDYAHGGPPAEPQWPPSAELVASIERPDE